MSRTELTVVRHGESNWNTEGRQQGHLDSGLSERGRTQAQAIAARLRGQHYAAVYTSDLGRAKETALIIDQLLGIGLSVEPRLRERHLGVFQGLTWPEIEQQHPEAFQAFNTGDPDYVIPGGESAHQRFERTVGCLENIARKHVGTNVLVVAHSGVLNGLMHAALQIPLGAPRRFKLWNASLSLFSFADPDGWTLGTWGDVAHLADLGTLDDK